MSCPEKTRFDLKTCSYEKFTVMLVNLFHYLSKDVIYVSYPRASSSFEIKVYCHRQADHSENHLLVLFITCVTVAATFQCLSKGNFYFLQKFWVLRLTL